MVNNLKRIILISILVLSIILVVLFMQIKKTEDQNGAGELIKEDENPVEINEEELSKNISIVNNENDFFTMQSILQDCLLKTQMQYMRC